MGASLGGEGTVTLEISYTSLSHIVFVITPYMVHLMLLEPMKQGHFSISPEVGV